MDYGIVLKDRRLEKKITLEEVSYDLKISLEHLRNIEDSKTEYLPKPPFTKGYLRNYCQYLELDPAEVIQGYEETLTEEQTRETKVGLSDPFEPKTFFVLDFLKEKLVPITILSLIILAVALVVTFLKGHKTLNESGLQQAKKSLVTSKLVAEQQQSESQGAVLEKDLLDYSAEPEKVVSPTTEKAPVKHRLVIHPLAETSIYIKTNLDSKPIRAVLKLDRKRVFSFESAEIKFLDAGAVSAFMDGKDLGALGTFGQVKTIAFPSLREVQ